MAKKWCWLLALVWAVLAVPVSAQSLASKIDYLGTSQYLKVTGLKTRVMGGLLNLSIDITNSDNEDQVGYYRLEWYDRDGFPAWGDEAWKPLLLHGSQTQHILVTAPTPKAQDFKIEFSAELNSSSSNNPSPGDTNRPQ